MANESEFPKLPEGYRWKVVYCDPGFNLDKVTVSIKRGWSTVASDYEYLGHHNNNFRGAATIAARLAWRALHTPSHKEAARSIEVELNSGVLTS